MPNNATFYELIERLGMIIRARIASGDYSESSLARALGVSQPHLHNILKGIRRMSVELADQVMSELGISVLDLIHSGAENTQRKPLVQSKQRRSDSGQDWQRLGKSLGHN